MSFHRETKVKACRKACRCDWCDEVIKMGEPKVAVAGFYEDFYSCSRHPECQEAAGLWWKEREPAEDYLPSGGMKRGSTEAR